MRRDEIRWFDGTRLTVTVLFLFTFFNLILDASRTSTPSHLLSTSLSSSSFLIESQIFSWDSGQEQLIPYVGRFKPAFAERDKQQAMIDLRGISSNWFAGVYILENTPPPGGGE